MAGTPLARFAEGLKRDAAAVQNALELPWTTSPVEGQVNRIIPAVGSLDRWLGRPSSSRGSSEPGAGPWSRCRSRRGGRPPSCALARRERDGRVSARLLALANALDGMSRDQAARAAGMDRQTLRDWVHRYNAEGVEGLRDRPRPGRPCALDEGQQAALRGLILRGPRLERDGCVAWRARDLRGLAERRFGGRYGESGGRRLLRGLDLSWREARPVHPQADPKAQERFKKSCRT